VLNDECLALGASDNLSGQLSPRQNTPHVKVNKIIFSTDRQTPDIGYT